MSGAWHDQVPPLAPRTACRAHIPFEALTQAGALKETCLPQLLRTAGTRWWHEHLGRDWDAYLAEESVRPLVAYLRISCAATSLGAGTEANLAIEVAHGHIPDWRGNGARFGGFDRLQVTVDGHAAPVATWVCLWYWLAFEPGTVPTFVESPPPGLLRQDPQLPRVPPRPDGGSAEPVAELTWTPRESDLNEHVFFMSYLERGQNALADAGLPATYETTEIWYGQPAFSGQHMAVAVDQRDAGSVVVVIRRADTGGVCARIRFS